MAQNNLVSYLFMILRSGLGFVKTAVSRFAQCQLGWPPRWRLEGHFQDGGPTLTWWLAGPAIGWETSWGWQPRTLVLAISWVYSFSYMRPLCAVFILGFPIMWCSQGS